MFPRRRGERGIALIAVLWVTLLLGLVAVSFLRETRVGTRLASGALASARAEALADAGIYWAMLGLLTADPAAAIRPDGRVYVVELEGGAVRVAVQDEGGKIDLNRASEEVLRAAFAAARADRPDELAARLADFRDPDNERRERGAEAADYATTGRAAGPKNGNLVSIDELQQVLGVTRDLFARVQPFVTVHSPRRDVDLISTPMAVLRMLPHLSAEHVEAAVAARQNGAHRPMTTTIVATVISEATTLGGGRFVRRAVIRRGADPLRPFEILEWRRDWQLDPMSASE